jgi:hypothetical protein
MDTATEAQIISTAPSLRPLERLEQAVCGYNHLYTESAALHQKLFPEYNEYAGGPNWKEYLPDDADPADVKRYEEIEEVVDLANEEFFAAVSAYTAAPESEKVAARLAEAVRTCPSVRNVVLQNQWYRRCLEDAQATLTELQPSVIGQSRTEAVQFLRRWTAHHRERGEAEFARELLPAIDLLCEGREPTTAPTPAPAAEKAGEG